MACWLAESSVTATGFQTATKLAVLWVDQMAVLMVVWLVKPLAARKASW